MARHLTEGDRSRIVGILDGWPVQTKLTWDALVEQVGQRLGIRPTRQTLYRHPDIRIAFDTKRKGASRSARRSVTAAVLLQRVERLTAENERLSRENELLLEQFVRWQYNAHKRGLTPEMLEEPLPRIDRGRSD